mmetsp:Transcript_5115/g.10014  ORF Transcript_5115/g.10014 Transcript_5115/m.10014 type:complete len:201 (+) Transcript_5115:830-1432(+)
MRLKSSLSSLLTPAPSMPPTAPMGTPSASCWMALGSLPLALHRLSSALASSGLSLLLTMLFSAAFSLCKSATSFWSDSKKNFLRRRVLLARMRLRSRRRSIWAWDLFCRPPTPGIPFCGGDRGRGAPPGPAETRRALVRLTDATEAALKRGRLLGGWVIGGTFMGGARCCCVIGAVATDTGAAAMIGAAGASLGCCCGDA